MNSELKRSIHKHHLIAAIASISLGFLSAVVGSNDSGWSWLGFLIILASASLLLFVVGLCLPIFKEELATAFVLSSVLLTGSYLIGLYVIEKANLIFYGERQYKELPPESYGKPYKELPPESNEQSNNQVNKID